MTLGGAEDDFLHMVQFHWENDKYQEVRSVHNFGHKHLEGEEERRFLQQLEFERELDQLIKDMKDDRLTEEKRLDLLNQYREKFHQLKILLDQRDKDDAWWRFREKHR